jgi:hypothetical protein
MTKSVLLQPQYFVILVMPFGQIGYITVGSFYTLPLLSVQDLLPIDASQPSGLQKLVEQKKEPDSFTL